MPAAVVPFPTRNGVGIRAWRTTWLIGVLVCLGCSGADSADDLRLRSGPVPNGAIPVDFQSLPDVGDRLRSIGNSPTGGLRHLDLGERIVLRPRGLVWDSRLGILVGDNGGKVIYRVPVPPTPDVAMIGGAGSGPGEFTSLQLVGTTETSLIAVYSPMHQTLTFLDSTGAFVAQRRIGHPDWGNVYAKALLPDGELVVTQIDHPGAPAGHGVTEDSGTVEIVTPDGHAISVGRFSIRDRVRRSGRSGTEHRGSPPFGRDLLLTAGDGLVVIAENKEPTIRVYDHAGTLLRVLWLGIRPPRVSDEAKQEYRRTVEPFLRVAAEEWTILSGEDVFAERFPPFRHLLFDDAGRVWAFAWPSRSDANAGVFIFDPDGEALAITSVPGRFDPSAVRGDTLLGWVLDSLGVASPSLFRVDM